MTREIPLSQGMVAIVDDADYARVLAAGPWHAVEGRRTFYARRNARTELGWRSQGLHAFLLGTSGVDHADGDGLNNTRANLRAATEGENAANRPTRRDSRSGYKGVSPNGPRGLPWRAQIHVQGQRRHLGLFPTPELAARAYDEAAISAWGEFARLNFPKENIA